MTAYDSLENKFARLSHLSGAEAVLHWDTAVMMPSGGAEARAGQLATLAVIQHEFLTAPEMADLLQAAGEEALDDWQRANLRQMRRSCSGAKHARPTTSPCSVGPWPRSWHWPGRPPR